MVPIPKPNKDISDPTNYRPIALMSCLCKTMERMVNDRLVWVLESKKLLSKFQCGFRKDHSTLDHLVCYEHFIREAFARNKFWQYSSTWRKLTIPRGNMEFKQIFLISNSEADYLSLFRIFFLTSISSEKWDNPLQFPSSGKRSSAGQHSL